MYFMHLSLVAFNNIKKQFIKTKPVGSTTTILTLITEFICNLIVNVMCILFLSIVYIKNYDNVYIYILVYK